MEQCIGSCVYHNETGDAMTIIKEIKKKYNVLDKEAKKAEVKANKTDTGGNFYVYDLYDTDGILIALNRYVHKDIDEQPFDSLTPGEESILNPPIIEPEPKMEVTSSGK